MLRVLKPLICGLVLAILGGCKTAGNESELRETSRRGARDYSREFAVELITFSTYFQMFTEAGIETCRSALQVDKNELIFYQSSTFWGDCTKNIKDGLGGIFYRELRSAFQLVLPKNPDVNDPFWEAPQIWQPNYKDQSADEIKKEEAKYPDGVIFPPLPVKIAVAAWTSEPRGTHGSGAGRKIAEQISRDRLNPGDYKKALSAVDLTLKKLGVGKEYNPEIDYEEVIRRLERALTQSYPDAEGVGEVHFTKRLLPDLQEFYKERLKVLKALAKEATK